MPESAFRSIGLGLALLGLTTLAAAQLAPPTPGAVTEGLDARRLSLPDGAPAEFLFPRDTPAPAAHDPSARRFLVNGFTFVGNTIFPEALLRRVTERFLDLQLNLNDLNQAADAVTRFYREWGFPVAGAFVPAQRVVDGLVVIQVVEGRLGKLSFDGAQHYSDAFLERYLQPLLEQPQVTIGQLERSLLLMNDLPGLRARATLAPGTAQGETDATLALEEKPFGITAQLNNWGRKEAGEKRLDIGVTWNNPLGFGDQLSWRGMRSEHDLMRYQRLGYSFPLGADGLRFNMAASSVDYEMAGDFAALGIEGLVDSREVGLTYALRRSRISNILLSANLRSTRSRQSALDTSLGSNRLNVLALGAIANWVHEDSSTTTLSTIYSSNFRNNHHQDPKALRGKLDVDFTHLSGLSPHWDMFTRINVVLGAGWVPDAEKFSLGGPDSVRGYRIAEYRGDRGFLLTVEFRRQFLLANLVGVWSIFHDQGGVRNSGFAGQDHLASWGTGVTLYPGKISSVRADLAWPTSSKNRPKHRKSGARVWLSGNVSF